MISINQAQRLKRHKEFAKDKNEEPMIHRKFINTEADNIEYEAIDDHYKRNHITSAGNKLD